MSPPVRLQTSHVNAIADFGVLIQIQRKARRKNQGDLVRALDAVLPEAFRRGMSFNGAGSRALGITGRSLHDVLEDSILTVAWLRAAKRPRVEAVDTTPCKSPRKAKTTAQAQHSADLSCGPHMRAFLDSNGGLDDMLADIGPFVCLTTRLDAGGRRSYAKQSRDTSRDTLCAMNVCSSVQSSLPVQPGASVCPSSTATSRTSSISLVATGSNSCGNSTTIIAPLLIDTAAPLGDFSSFPRLPPITCLSVQLTHDGQIHRNYSNTTCMGGEAFGMQQPWRRLVVGGQQGTHHFDGGNASNLLQQLRLHQLLLQQGCV